MKDWLVVLKFIKNYKGRVFMHIITAIVAVLGSVFTFAMIGPFLNVLFGLDEIITEPVPLSLSTKDIMHNLNYVLGLLITEYGHSAALALIIAMVIFFSLIRNLFQFLSLSCLAPVRSGVAKDIRNNLYGKILTLPLAYFSKERKGDLIARMTTDVHEIEWSILSSLEAFLHSPIEIIAYFSLLMFMSPKLTLVALAILPLSILILGLIGGKLKKSAKDAQSRMGGILNVIEETLGGMRIIKAFTAEKLMFRGFKEKNGAYARVQTSIFRRNFLASPLSEFLSTAIICFILWFGGSLVLNDDSTIEPATFITYLVFFSQILPPAKKMATANYNLKKGMASIARIDEVMNAKNPIVQAKDAVAISTLEHSITYKDVWFKYQEQWVLKNINLTIERGKTIALVGQSGSGKSTMVDMLPRFYDVTKGEVCLDDKNVKDFIIPELRNMYGIVNQEPILFNDTIYNNIAFGLENPCEQDVIEAAKIANAHDFIMLMPEGYQTNIGDRGGKLSGGQRQRLSIARAILHNPPILILDEATSSLDSESERLVQDALENLIKDRTSIVIAHRLSTIHNADLICVLHDGEIVERGTHKELIAIENGVYHKLYNMQSFQ